jgi:hypothetical protein
MPIHQVHSKQYAEPDHITFTHRHIDQPKFNILSHSIFYRINLKHKLLHFPHMS